MRFILYFVLALVALAFADTKSADAQVIVCAGYDRGIPFGCRPRQSHAQQRHHRPTMSHGGGVYRQSSQYSQRTVTRHSRKTVYRGTVVVPRASGGHIANVTPVMPKRIIPPGTGQVTRLTEFDNGQAFCDKYVPVPTTFRYWKGSGPSRKAHCE